jgi:hypothetical protein
MTPNQNSHEKTVDLAGYEADRANIEAGQALLPLLDPSNPEDASLLATEDDANFGMPELRLPEAPVHPTPDIGRAIANPVEADRRIVEQGAALAKPAFEQLKATPAGESLMQKIKGKLLGTTVKKPLTPAERIEQANMQSYDRDLNRKN